MSFYSLSCFAANTLDNSSRQLLLVQTKDWNTTQASLQRYQRKNNKAKWIAVGQPVSVVIGKNGLAWSVNNHPDAEGPIKQEGDLRSPAGVFLVKTAFGFTPQKDKKIHIPYQFLSETSVCVDDAKSKYYNQIINTTSIIKRDWNSGEQMKQIPQYKLGAVIEYNTNSPLANAGSCIFLHIWRNPDAGTAGCVAMSESDLKHILYWLDPQQHPAIALVTKNILKRYGAAWKLPDN